MSKPDPSARLTPLRLLHGRWEGVLSQPGDPATPPGLVARLGETPLAPPVLEPLDGGERWQVVLEIPSEVLSDGMQVVTIHPEGSDEVLAHIALIAGDVLRQDLRGEVELLRAELDMLKAAFRRHCQTPQSD